MAMNELRGRWHRRAAAVLVIAGLHLPVAAQDPDVARLVFPEGRETYTVDDDIVIRFDPQAAQWNDAWLVELDALDVTALAVRSGYGLMRLRPVKRLAPGTHRLRLIRETASRELIEVAVWQLELQRPERQIEAGMVYAADVQGSSTVLNSEDLDEAREHVVSGSLRLEPSLRSRRLAVQAAANLYASSNADRLGQDDLELGDFRVSAGSESLQLVAGHFAAATMDGRPYGSLAYDGVSRRGVGLSARLPVAGANLAVFSQGSEPVSGFRRGFALSRPEQRLSGGMLALQPLAGDDHRVDLTLGYIEGRSLSGGTAIYDAGINDFAYTPGIDGSVGSAVLDTQWLSGALALRAEYARSERQFPMVMGVPVDPVRDDAQVYTLSYRPLDGIALGAHRLTSHLTLEHQKVGTAFRSVGAPGGLVDLDQNRIAAGLQYATVALDVSATRSEDNVADGPLPTTRADSLFAQLGWTPELTGWTLPPFLQQPSLSVGAGRDRRRTVALPENDAGFRADDDSRSLTTSLSFVQPYGDWSLNYSRSATDDRTGQAQAYRGDSGSMDISFYFGDRLSLSAQLFTDLSRQLQLRAGDADPFAFSLPKTATRTHSGTLSLQWQVVPERWQLSLGYSADRSRTSDETYRTRGEQVDVGSNWRVWQLNLFVRGSYQRMRDLSLILPFEDENGMPSAPEYNRSRRESYQAFAGLSLNFSGE